MTKNNQNLSSKEALEGFKKEIDNSLRLIGFLDSKDKEEAWKYWKTVSSAVKIAVNGKGDFISSSLKVNPKKNGRKDSNDSLSLPKNLSENTTTVYVPLSCTNKDQKRYRVLKFSNHEMIDDFIEVSENKEEGENNKDKKIIIEDDSQIDRTSIPTELISQICQLSCNNLSKQDIMAEAQMEICDNQADIDISSVTKPNDSDCSNHAPNVIEESCQPLPTQKPKSQRGQVKTFPFEKPATRSSSRVREKSSVLDLIPVKMRDERIRDKVNKVNCSEICEDSKNDFVTNVPVAKNNKTNKKQNFVNEHDATKSCQVQNKELTQPMHCEDKSSSQAKSPTKNLPLNVVHEIKNDLINSESKSCSSHVVYATNDDKIDDSVVIASSNVDIQLGEIKMEVADSNADSNNENVEKVIPDSPQKVNNDALIQQQPPRSPSDIEKIISALEEELKKTGSEVHSISITSSENCSTLDIHTTKEENVQILPATSQELATVQNVEDVIWNPSDGSSQFLGAHALIDTTEVVAVVDDSAAAAQPIDTQYDVVEYEVLAENGTTHRGVGSKKRKREKDSQSANAAVKNKDTLDRTCPMCHRVLTYPSSMAAHMRTHTGDRPYSCGQCDRKFTTKANRDRHEATHIGLKPFKCDQCDKCFTEKRSLKIHMRAHTGERPFVCAVCNRAFAQKCTLMVHMDRHTNKKGHLCDLCGKAFRQKCQLDVHVKRHNRQANHPCPECSIRCYTKGDLVRHMIKHTGERPYSCSVCTKTFTRKQYLMDHENSHYGRRPYKCSVCSADFQDMRTCQKHLQKHEEEGMGISANGIALKEAASVLSAEDYNSIVKNSQAGKILTLEDGTEALVTAVDTEADGVTVYHVTCVDNQQADKLRDTDSNTINVQELKYVTLS